MAEEKREEYTDTGLTYGGSCEPKSFVYKHMPYYGVPCGCPNTNCRDFIVAQPTYWHEAFVIGGLVTVGILCAALILRTSRRRFATSFHRRTQ